MKKIYLLLAFLLYNLSVIAQLNATLNVTSNPSPRILEWASQPETVTLSVSNSSTNSIQYKIKATVLKDGSLVARTKLNQMPTEEIMGGGFESYYVEDLVPNSALDIVDQSINNTVLRTGKLPAGNYLFCVELVNPSTQANLSPRQCRPFRITDYQPPRLILPISSSTLSNDGSLQFSWTPVQPATLVTYTFKMVELREGQNEFLAFTENQSYMSTILENQTSLFYTNDFPELEDGKTYIWSVQAIGIDDEVIGGDNGFKGWAKPFLFTTTKNKSDDKGDDEETDDEKKDGEENDDKGKEKEEDKAKQDYVDCNCANDIVAARARLKRFSYDPLKIELLDGQTSAAGVRKCLNEELEGVSNIVIDSKVYWGDGNSSIVRANSTDEHTYTNTESIPNEVCVEMVAEYTYKRKRLTCKQTYCLPVKDDTEYDTQLPSCLDQDLDFAIFSNENLSISVSDRSTINVDNDVNYSTYWDMGDGQLYDNIDSVAHEYDADGLYTITLNYVFQKGEESITCDYLKNKSVSIDCNARIYINKTDTDFVYTFRDSIVFINIVGTDTPTIDSVNWSINGKYIINGPEMVERFNRTRKYEVCHNVYLTNPDGTKCKKTRCIPTILEGCAFQECDIQCDTLSTQTFTTGDVISLCGDFELELTDVTSGSSSSLSGKGKVYVPWLMTDVAVEFSSLKINSSNKLCYGEVWVEQHATAPEYPQQWGINVAAEMVLGQPFLTSIENWVNNNSGQPPINLNTEISNQVNPVLMPLGVNNAEGYTLALSAMVFRPERNLFSAMAIVPIDVLEEHKLGFEATSITFTSSGPIDPTKNGGTGGIELIEPITIHYTADDDVTDVFAITFNKSGDGHIGTGFGFNNPCGEKVDWCFRVDADFEMPRKWLLPIPDLGNKVSTNVQTEICDWKDWLVDIDLPRCEITNSEGFELEITDMVLDFSSVRNQPGQIFPDNWVGDQTESFEGFWLNQAKLYFPDDFTTFSDPTRRLETQLNNWIIQKKKGITGELLALNVIQMPNGNVADLAFSIDTFRFNMVQNSFTRAYMSGKILLPVTDDNPANALNYTALLGTGNGNDVDGFQFIMQPDGPITSEFFAGADLELYETSYLNLTLEDVSKTFDISLNGMIDLPDEITNPINGNPIPIDFNTTFEGVGLFYEKRAGGSTMTFNEGTWATASPSKKVFNFPVSIENFNHIMKAPTGTELVTGGASFDAIINLAGGKIGGRTTIEIIGAIDKPDGERLQPVFKEVNLSSINIYADLAAVKMDGTVDFFNNHIDYGNGVRGTIDARFKAAGTAIAASAWFGTTDLNASGLYRYWKVEAQATFPPPGIPFLPGVVFRGFGAGAYHRMSATVPANPISLASGATSNPVFTGVTFEPDPTIAFGFKAKAIMATSPKEESFNGNVGISGEFSSSGGMTFIGFDGSFKVGTAITNSNADAVTYGSVSASYDFPSKIFDFGADVVINNPPITTPTPISFDMYIDGGTNKWYVKVGEPDRLNRVKVLGVNVDQYLMFGNDIYSPSGFMADTRTGYSAATNGGIPGIGNVGNQVNNSNTQAGKGFAFGIGANFTDEGALELTERIGIGYSFNGGFEVNGSLMQYDPNYICDGRSPVGIEGWRMKGGLCGYAGLDVQAYMAPKSKAILCINGCYLDIVSAGFGAWVQGEFPNPSYLAGGVDVHYDLWGVINGEFNAEFEVGNRCYGNIMMGGGNFIQEDAAEEQGRRLISSVTPQTSGGVYGARVDTSSTIRAVFGFTPTQTFEAAETQSNGTVINRTFQAMYESTLFELDSDGEWVDVSQGLDEQINSIGEHIFSYTPVSTGFSLETATAETMQAMIPYTTNGNSSTTTSSLGYGLQEYTGIIFNSMLPYNNNPDNYDDIAENDEQLVSDFNNQTMYKYELTGTLYELVGSDWVVAKNNESVDVVETRLVVFSTPGYEPVVQTQTSSFINTSTFQAIQTEETETDESSPEDVQVETSSVPSIDSSMIQFNRR